MIQLTETAYKLTTQAMTTHGGFKWALGKTYRTSGEGPLCGKGWLHFYASPLLAVFLNPIHADIKRPRMFRAVCGGKRLSDHGLKVGYTEAALVEEIALPVVALAQRIAFGILCTKNVYDDEGWNRWADRWLAGVDRTYMAAAGAAEAAGAAAAEAAAAAAEEMNINLQKLVEAAMAH
jgi:hypothetical protein